MVIIKTWTCPVSHHVLHFLCFIFSTFPYAVLSHPATFHSLDSHWMENSWSGDCPKHIMPSSSMNSHLPLPTPLVSTELPCSLSSFKVGLHSWNKRKTAFMRTCFSPTYGTHCLSSFLWISFPTLLPGDTSAIWLVLLLTSLKKKDVIQLSPRVNYA